MEPDGDVKDEDMDEAGDDGSGMEDLSDDNQGDEGSEIREMKHRLEKFGWRLMGFKFWLWHTSTRSHLKEKFGHG